VAFGFIGKRRPFGQDMLAHPLVVYFALAAIGLLILPAVLARPVPEFILERTLLARCVLGEVTFLAGNWVSTHLVGDAMTQMMSLASRFHTGVLINLLPNVRSSYETLHRWLGARDGKVTGGRLTLSQG